MKEKYTISIADIQLNVIADGDRDRIERVVGIIDRRMREILLKSHQCPKTQAALLCALDLCADKLEAKDEIEALREELAEANEETRRAKDNYDRVQMTNLKLEKDKAELAAENARLRELVEKAKSNNGISADEIAEVEQLTIEDVEKAAQPEQKPAPKKEKKSRVGSMFDLLTFSDI